MHSLRSVRSSWHGCRACDYEPDGTFGPGGYGPQSAPFPEHTVWAAWKTYCDSCHTGPKARAGVNLEALDLANLDKNGAVWEKVLTKLRNHTMPPPGSPMPDEATFQTLIKSITGERDRVADVRPTPGRPTLHRLNRAEYGNAVRDLLALERRRVGTAAARRQRLWLRQHRRRADRIAGVAGALSFGGRQDQPAGRGRRQDACRPIRPIPFRTGSSRTIA